MARKLERFPEELLSRTTSTYPWDEWLDGDVWELTQGEDYIIKSKSLRTTAQAAARAKGGRCRVAESDNGKKLIVQFLPHAKVQKGPIPRSNTIEVRTRDSDRTKSIRAWARQHGWPDLSEHGRLPGDVLQAFDRAESHPHGNVTHLPPRE